MTPTAVILSATSRLMIRILVGTYRPKSLWNGTKDLFRLFILASLLLTPPLLAQEVMQEIKVNPGDTMWSIANKYLKDPQKWPEIVKYNQLPTADPTIALPGSKIKIPVLLIKEEFRIAQLVKFIPEVRFKRKGEEEWKQAQADMTLKYEDSLRTMKGAQARVRFPSKEVVQINENSYVVLKPEKILQEIQLLEGDVRASRAKVIMPGGTVVKPQGNGSDYQAKVREDKTEVVFVYKGQVDVTAQGKTVTVREGFGTQVPKSAPPMEPMPLTNFKDFDPKELTTNSTNTQLAGQKPIKFTPPSPSPTPPSKPNTSNKSKSLVSKDILTDYKLQLARDNKFLAIILEKTEKTGQAFDIKKANIPDGTYFMRVAFVDALGVVGPYSETNTVTKDTEPPQLELASPQEGQKFSGDEASCDVMGTVKGATMVAINGEVVFISPTGRYSKTVYFKEGSNKIAVVARDVHGNQTLLERKVTYSKGR